MEFEHSSAWMDLREKDASFRSSISFFNQNLGIEAQALDILAALDHDEEVFIATRLMAEGYFSVSLVERIWEKLLFLVFHAHISAAKWASDALLRLPFAAREKHRAAIAQLVFEYARKLAEDSQPLRFGMDLLYRMNFQSELELYMQEFKKPLYLDEEDFTRYLQ